ncbi:MAG TPA: PH domain-containing protein [Povalibacter sp.]|nr:PH domain-containing protein [Povalibacter sp.]
MASEPQFEPRLKLHPLSWLFALVTYVRQLIVPLAAIVIFGANDDTALWGLFAIVPLLAIALWHQWIYRYGFGPRGLVIQEGLLFRNVRQIEYPRIENIDVERGLLHRLLGVAQVSIATSTGGKAEASIRVLSLAAVQEMRERIFTQARTSREQQAVETGSALLHLPPSELVRYGFIDNRGMIIVAALAGVVYQSGFVELLRAHLDDWLDSRQLAEFAALGFAMQVAFAAIVVLAIFASLRLLSVVLALITLFDFTLTRDGQDLRIRHGLLTRLALTLRVKRVQAVHRSETLLHRWFGRVSLRVDLAGDSGADRQGKQQSQNRTRWLAPICTAEQAQVLIAAALPEVDLTAEPDWQPLAPRAGVRLFKQTIYVWAVLTLAGFAATQLIPHLVGFDSGWVLLFALVGPLVAWARSHIYVRHTRWALTPGAILFRYGWLTRRLIIAPRQRVQSVTLSASPFDRRYAMAAVFVDTAGAGALHDRIRIPMLPRLIAEQLAIALYALPPQGIS